MKAHRTMKGLSYKRAFQADLPPHVVLKCTAVQRVQACRCSAAATYT